MENDTQIADIEQRYARWSGPSTAFVVPAVLLSVFSIPMVMTFRDSLHPWFYLTPVVMISAVLFAQIAASSWDRRTRRTISAHYASKYMGTKWRTPADAEGVVIEVSEFGECFRLAFPSGVIERYERQALVMVAR